MNREDIIRMAQETGLYSGNPRTPGTGRTIEGRLMRFAALVAAAEREKVAHFIMAQCFSTGHGDTVESMLDALVRQVAEREREVCIGECERIAAAAWDKWEQEADGHSRSNAVGAFACIEVIRARGAP